MIDMYNRKPVDKNIRLTDELMRTIEQLRRLGISKKELSMVVDSVYKVPDLFYRGGEIHRKIQ